MQLGDPGLEVFLGLELVVPPLLQHAGGPAIAAEALVAGSFVPRKR